jgi:hypothetical protein
VKRFVFALVALIAAVSSANAWNNKGHMVVARLAWKELTPDERAKVVQFLEKHPHFEEFLKDDKPGNMTQDEWVFLRAATWADWVKAGPASRRKFSRPQAHFVNLPFVPPESAVNPPPFAEKNVIQQINESKLKARAGGSQEERAVEFTWLFHLVGDIHQPLHCITLFSDDFPHGDRGGNRALIRNDGRVVQMHRFWDGLLGRPTTLSSIGSTVLEIETMVQNNPNALNADLAAHQTPAEWAKESFELGKRIAYLNGRLRPANDDDDPTDPVIPTVPDDYAENAGETARFCVAKAGKRLAQVLREVLASN